MSNIANLTETRLDTIARNIADAASKTIENIWTIGANLNDAKSMFDDDQSFGTWRRDHVTVPLGIADRTQRTFMRVAANWPLDALPRFLGITALADVAGLPEVQQSEALSYLENAAVDGKRVAVSTATRVVKLAREGASVADIEHRIPAAAIPETRDVDPIPAPVREREPAPAVEPPVVVDNDTGDVVQPTPRAVKSGDTPEAWAKTVVQRISRENGHRREFLAALKAELTTAGMFEVTEGTVSMVDTGRKARIVVSN